MPLKVTQRNTYQTEDLNTEFTMRKIMIKKIMQLLQPEGLNLTSHFKIVFWEITHNFRLFPTEKWGRNICLLCLGHSQTLATATDILDSAVDSRSDLKYQ